MNEDRATELVFAIVAPIGADREKVFRLMEDELRLYSYKTTRVRLSKSIASVMELDRPDEKEELRLNSLMDAGNELRAASGDNGVLGYLAAGAIREDHEKLGWDLDDRRFAYVIDTVKHPSEVHVLRQVYPRGFFLIALHVDRARRMDYLTRQKGMPQEEAERILERDESEPEGHGQSTRDTFHLADFFVHYNGNEDKLRNSISRAIRLVFGDPFSPPTFNEFAMYTAFVSSMRSADLSRQVGAAIAIDGRIIATGANEAPRFGGGQYWSEYSGLEHDVVDSTVGRDFKIVHDSNHLVKESIIDEMVEAVSGTDDSKEALRSTSFWDITEYGRAVHAEMEAILSCARSTQSTLHSDLYTTTYPCHNCAKHAISSGIRRIFFVEPYPKSRALELHGDAMSENRADMDKKLVLRPFVGVGPRMYVNCFSMDLGAGRGMTRKNKADGTRTPWSKDSALPRGRMLPNYYKEPEEAAAAHAVKLLESLKAANPLPEEHE